jgi:hypothetical protein
MSRLLAGEETDSTKPRIECDGTLGGANDDAEHPRFSQSNVVVTMDMINRARLYH